MATKRLTIFQRGQILKRLLEHRFSKEEADLAAAGLTLGGRVYLDVYDLALREQMAALPGGFLPLDNQMTVQFGNHVVRVTLAQRHRLAYDHKGFHAVAKVYPPEHKLTLAWEELEARESDYHQRYQEARDLARAMLASVTTVKKLLEVWPEVEPFLKLTEAEAPDRTLPVVPIEGLNARLGLPV